MAPEVEHSNTTDGILQGSLSPTELLMADMFDGTPDAGKPPVTPPAKDKDDQPDESAIEGEGEPETEEDEPDEAEPEGEEELPPQVKSLVETLEKEREELRKQREGMDKYFTEQSEKLKKLREEAGVEDANQADKSARKDMKALGFNADGEYIARDFARSVEGGRPAILSDSTLTSAAERGYIPKEVVPYVKGMRPVLNALANDIREEVLTQIRSGMEAVRSEYSPVIEEFRGDKLNSRRAMRWQSSIESFREKYKPTPEQEAVLREEIPNIWDIVDKVDPAEVEKTLRRIVYDPDVLKKSPVKPKKAKVKEEVKPQKKTHEDDLKDSEAVLASMYD